MVTTSPLQTKKRINQSVDPLCFLNEKRPDEPAILYNDEITPDLLAPVLVAPHERHARRIQRVRLNPHLFHPRAPKNDAEVGFFRKHDGVLLGDRTHFDRPLAQAEKSKRKSLARVFGKKERKEREGNRLDEPAVAVKARGGVVRDEPILLSERPGDVDVSVASCFDPPTNQKEDHYPKRTRSTLPFNNILTSEIPSTLEDQRHRTKRPPKKKEKRK